MIYLLQVINSFMKNFELFKDGKTDGICRGMEQRILRPVKESYNSYIIKTINIKF